MRRESPVLSRKQLEGCCDDWNDGTKLWICSEWLKRNFETPITKRDRIWIVGDTYYPTDGVRDTFRVQSIRPFGPNGGRELRWKDEDQDAWLTTATYNTLKEFFEQFITDDFLARIIYAWIEVEHR